MNAERIACAFHEAYERLAPDHGYKTREASAKPWKDVPEGNKGLMIATVQSLIDEGVIGGSTPVASPPRSWDDILADMGRKLDAAVLPPTTHAPALGIDTAIVGDFTEVARAAAEGRPLNPKAFVMIENVAEPTGEVVSVPPPAPLATGGIITDPPLFAEPDVGCTLTVPSTPVQRCTTSSPHDEHEWLWAAAFRRQCPGVPAPADEPAPVPPPVDALLGWVDDLASAVRDDGPAEADRARGHIVMAARDLWAAGVSEGRRQRDKEIRASVFTSVREVAEEAGFAPVPESVTVSYERRASAYEEGIYDAGIAEGRRQATEERTEEAVRIAVDLDSPEYRRQLQKMIRTGEIQVPPYRRGEDCPTCGASGDDRD